ncbi:hypothetical protein AeNC1_012700 [Aphanomyces euteiches]|nr:hypothetical protein AeNC1_012700 [Aphanomyces euteiches]
MVEKNKSILLIMDKASSHKAIGVQLTNIRLLMLPANTTSFLQPLDAGIIASFKRGYKCRQMKHAVSLIDGITDGCKLTSKMFAVDVLVAMRWLTEAWEEVPLSTMSNCWKHTGIVERGAVERRVPCAIGRFSLDFLLNPSQLDG